MTQWQWLFLWMVVFPGLPFLIYLSVKLATWAYLKAHRDFDEQYNHNHNEEEG